MGMGEGLMGRGGRRKGSLLDLELFKRMMMGCGLDDRAFMPPLADLQ
jgi:hypothetical protein